MLTTYQTPPARESLEITRVSFSLWISGRARVAARVIAAESGVDGGNDIKDIDDVVAVHVGTCRQRAKAISWRNREIAECDIHYGHDIENVKGGVGIDVADVRTLAQASRVPEPASDGIRRRLRP